MRNKSGFTIVELLIVIVVIAILAAISIVAYNGIQDRAIASQRASDMATIVKALEMYKLQTGNYPAVQGNSSGGWERSAVNPENFLSALKTEKIIDKVPVDPINAAPQGAMGPENTFISYTYYRYPAGAMGCDTDLGQIYVLKIEHPGKPRIEQSPGLSCGAIQTPTYGSGNVYWKGQSTN